MVDSRRSSLAFTVNKKSGVEWDEERLDFVRSSFVVVD
jgi:hypothetical protein